MKVLGVEIGRLAESEVERRIDEARDNERAKARRGRKLDKKLKKAEKRCQRENEAMKDEFRLGQRVRFLDTTYTVVGYKFGRFGVERASSFPRSFDEPMEPRLVVRQQIWPKILLARKYGDHNELLQNEEVPYTKRVLLRKVRS